MTPSKMEELDQQIYLLARRNNVFTDFLLWGWIHFELSIQKAMLLAKESAIFSFQKKTVNAIGSKRENPAKIKFETL